MIIFCFSGVILCFIIRKKGEKYFSVVGAIFSERCEILVPVSFPFQIMSCQLYVGVPRGDLSRHFYIGVPARLSPLILLYGRPPITHITFKYMEVTFIREPSGEHPRHVQMEVSTGLFLPPLLFRNPLGSDHPPSLLYGRLLF